MTQALPGTLADAASFHAANPAIYDLFVEFTFQAIEAGLQHIGAMTVIQRIRWETQVETRSEDGYKVNNNHAAFYARLFMHDYPQHEGFFRTRVLRSRLVRVSDE